MRITINALAHKRSGTGKTTIARKFGQVYYDMGFLASAKVEECSASDLVGQFIGHTGPKTKKLFEKALGQVLFIDEAYRLGDGRFAQEAVDELVGLLTHEKFKSKIVVILAGYDNDINKLLSVNSGLSSRFPEVIQFQNIAPRACLEILDKRLRSKKITLDELRDPSSKGYSAMLSVVEDLSGTLSWGNARDMETLAKQMSGLVLKQLPDSNQPAELTLQTKDAVTVMHAMLDEKRERSNMPPRSRYRYEDMQEASSSSGPPPPTAQQQPSSLQPPPPPPQQRKQQSALPSQQQKQQQQPPTRNRSRRQRMSNTAASSHSPAPASTSSTSPPRMDSGPGHHKNQETVDECNHKRDSGVSDDIWEQLQADEKMQAEVVKKTAEEIGQTQKKMKWAIQDQERIETTLQASHQAEAAASDAAARQEAKRQREALEHKQRKAKAARERLVNALKRKQEEEQKKKDAERKVQATLGNMGVCVQGYQWVKQPHGYRCRGGAHFISNGQLNIT